MPGDKNGKIDKKTKAIQERLDAFASSLPDPCGPRPGRLQLLAVILGFLSIVLAENHYRFLLGLLDLYSPFSQKEIADASGKSPATVYAGRMEAASGKAPRIGRERNEGAGRKKTTDKVAGLLDEIIRFVELRSYGPCTRGIGEYTAATAAGIRDFILRKLGVAMSVTAVRCLLLANGIRLRKNRKLMYANQDCENTVQRAVRHMQFDYIDTVKARIGDSSAIVLSLDCKKKENLGCFSSGGTSYTLKDRPVVVSDHDFFKPLDFSTLEDMDDLLDRQEGKAIPYGIYDIQMNKGYVNVGITHDTPGFIRASLEKFLPDILDDHPGAGKIFILCDGGGSNSSRSSEFKWRIAQFSRAAGMPVEVVHYPPYRSKFNPVERKLFAPVSRRFSESPLFSLRTVLAKLNGTTTKKGLVVKASLDVGVYELKQKPTQEQMGMFSIEYTGPTKDLKSKLSYVIDGTAMTGDAFTEAERKTVFDLRQNTAAGE